MRVGVSPNPSRGLTAAIALAASGAAFALLTVVMDSPRPQPPVKSSEIAPIPEIRLGPPETIPLRTQSVTSVAATPDGIWVSALSMGEPPIPLLLRLESQTGEIEKRVEVASGTVDGLVAGSGAVWGIRGESAELVRIDSRTGEQEPLRSGVGGMVEVAAGSLWVMADGPAGGPYILLRLDPNTGEVQGRMEIPAPVWAAAASGLSLWLVPFHGLDGSVIRVDTTTNHVVDRISVAEPGTVGNVVAAGDGAWVFIIDRVGTVVKVELGENSTLARDVSGELTSTILGVSHGRVWLLSESGAIDALNAETLESDQNSDAEWDVWPTSAKIDPSAAIDPATGDIWVGNYEGSVTHIPIDEVTSQD
jgi:hypothetical protein